MEISAATQTKSRIQYNVHERMGGGVRTAGVRTILLRSAGFQSIVQPPNRRGNSNMTQPQKGGGRKPATKFANLRKKMDQSKMRTKMQTMRVRKSGNR
jgi:hypothetical protein